jgi:hypothetical protein
MAEMISPPWNNFLGSLLCFVVVRSNHDEGLGRISFRSERRMKIQDTRKTKFLNSACRNVGRHSLGIYSQAFCRVFACAVIHMNRHPSLDLRFLAIQSVGTI